MAKPAKVKTKENDASVTDFINAVTSDQKRKDSLTLIHMMQTATQEQPKMWGASLIGFGSMRYKSPTSGREVDWFKIGFSPRKANLSLYLMGLDPGTREAALKVLGKHKTDGGCVYINKLVDIDMKVLEEMIEGTLKGK